MLIEGLASATIANGIMRVETLHQAPNGQDASSGVILIPVNRIGIIIQGLADFAQRAQEAAQAQQPPKADLN